MNFEILPQKMKFSDSPTINLPITGGATITGATTPATTLTFQQDNNSLHVGTSVWPCSLLLVKFFDRWLHHQSPPNPNPNPYLPLLIDLPSKRAIELGSGCGPAGLGLAALGLHKLLLTDISPVLPALRRNLKLNKSKLARAPKVQQLWWNKREQIAEAKGPFDLVIAADVVYMEDSAGWLVEAMAELVKEEGGVVVLGYQVRSVEADRVFWEGVGRVFGDVEKVRREDLHPEYAYEEADLYFLRKKKKKV